MGIVKKLKISAQSIVIHPLWKQSDGLPIFPLHIHSLLSIPILCPIASDLLIKTKLSLITFLWWIIRRAALLYWQFNERTERETKLLCFDKNPTESHTKP